MKKNTIWRSIVRIDGKKVDEALSNSKERAIYIVMDVINHGIKVYGNESKMKKIVFSIKKLSK